MDEKIIVAIIGLISGGIASLIAPWAKYGIEKAKIRLKNRKEQIRKLRTILDAEDFNIEIFREKSSYSQIKNYLPKKIQEDIESNILNVQLGGRGSGVNNFKPQLLDAITCLEKGWELI